MKKLDQLKWRCRRGIKELDILLTRYLEQSYEQASVKEQHIFQTLLELPDIELYSYLMAQKNLTEQTEQAVFTLVEKIRTLK